MIEFLEEPHLYLKDGILVKSVTQILQLIFPDKYKGINESVLKNKANFGTKGHSIIENLNVENIDFNYYKQFEESFRIVDSGMRRIQYDYQYSHYHFYMSLSLWRKIFTQYQRKL